MLAPRAWTVAGNTAYASNTGFYLGRLAQGNHTFEVKVRKGSADDVLEEPTSDWMTRALNVAVVHCD